MKETPSGMEINEAPGGKMTLAAGAAFGLSILFAIFTLRCLFADGSFYLVRVLQAGGFAPIASNRSFATYLFEFPAVIALKLGVTNIHWLALAFGVGCFCAWPIAMWLCYKLAPRHFWLVMLACALGYLNAAFNAAAEHVVAHAFFWPAAFVLLFVRPLTPIAAAILLASAGLLVRSYESLVFLGPALTGLVMWRLIFDKNQPWQKLVLAVSALLFLAATGYAAEGILHPVPGNYGGFKRGILEELTQPPWTLQMCYFWLVLTLAMKFAPVARVFRHPAGWVLTALAVFIWGAWPLLVPEQLNPATQHDSRFLDLLVPLMLLPVAILSAAKPGWLADQKQIWVRASAVMLLAQSLWHLSATDQWHGYVHQWKNLLAAKSGPVFLDDIYGAQNCENGQALRFDWYWANPCLSLMIGPAKVQALVMPGAAGWQPFDPLNPKDLPALGRYGLDYAAYDTALAQYNQTNRSNQPILPRRPRG